MTKTVKALEFRKRFGQILDEVGIKGNEVVVERAHHPLAVLIPYEMYQQKKAEAEEQERREAAAKAVAEWRRKYGHLYQGVDVVQEIRKLRRGR